MITKEEARKWIEEYLQINIRDEDEYTNVMSFIDILTQPTTLDSDVEEAIEIFKEIADDYVNAINVTEETQKMRMSLVESRYSTLRTAFSDMQKRIEMLKVTRTVYIEENTKLQSTLDKVREIVEYDSLCMSYPVKIREIKQLLKEEEK